MMVPNSAEGEARNEDRLRPYAIKRHHSCALMRSARSAGTCADELKDARRLG